jgi:hypothetical protein
MCDILDQANLNGFDFWEKYNERIRFKKACIQVVVALKDCSRFSEASFPFSYPFLEDEEHGSKPFSARLPEHQFVVIGVRLPYLLAPTRVKNHILFDRFVQTRENNYGKAMPSVEFFQFVLKVAVVKDSVYL